MQSKKLVIHSTLEELDQVYKWLNETLKPIVNESVKGNILLIAYEIVTNAIIHGNQKNPDKLVQIMLDMTNQNVIINIQDEGQGYDKLPSKEEAKELNYLEEGGRGLKLAVLICEKIELNKNSIKLIFNRDKKET